MTTELATREQGGAMTFRQATDAASVCKAIVTETAVKIGGRRYVRVEGWQAIAVAHGCVASAGGVERIQGGVRAIGEVKRASDGMVLSSAEGFVGDDEATWGKREEYAKRAMAQTRAISRACRSAFAHVVVLMNAGLETTPAEEVPSGGFVDAEVREPQPPSPPATTHNQPPPPPAPPPENDGAEHEADIVLGETKMKTGTGKTGKPWTRYYAKGDDGQFYSTFDHKLGGAMEAAAGLPTKIRYTIKTGPKGESRDLLGIEPVDAQAGDATDQPAGAQDAPTPEDIGDRIRKERGLPF
jgi:hypothetical protein